MYEEFEVGKFERPNVGKILNHIGHREHRRKHIGSPEGQEDRKSERF
jgi:hypothetical protein